MKHVLGSLALVAALGALAACGDQTDDNADDPETQRSSQGEARVVDIVSASAAHGTVSTEATVIEDDRALRRYLHQFGSPPFVADLTATVKAHEPAAGRVIGLAVIEISCDEPPSATVEEEHGAWVVTPGKVVSPHEECFVPVTSVAVLDLPAG